MAYKIAVTSLNQWALDFDGNLRRVLSSTEQAYDAGAVYRTGPELELCGYSLEDAFFETDNVDHCWQSLHTILHHTRCKSIIIDIGMPVHFGSLYNCRVICWKGRILCIRAKTSLAMEGNYRENRHFTAWPLQAGPVPYRVPTPMLSDGQSEFVPFGADFVLDLVNDLGTTLRLGWEICQELWDIKNVSADLYGKYGCHLVINSSGSYWELRKLDTVDDMIRGISLRAGACYAYANLFGCDGQRYVFSGRSCIYDRGTLKAMMPADSALLGSESQMIFYDVNPREIDEHRAQWGIRPNMNSEREHTILDLSGGHYIGGSHRVLQLKIDQISTNRTQAINTPVSVKYKFQDEINIYVSLWLWDYLRRSGLRGFMLPLSGGLDSSTVAMLVFGMCHHLCQVSSKCSVLEYLTRCHLLTPDEVKETLSSPQNLCRLLLKCTYISTEFSSQETESRARNLCKSTGANLSVVSVQDVYEICRQKSLGSRSPDEVTLLDQNLQARLRMTMTYLLSEGNRIVLASANVDEGIMGYLTKYDCSSADINPIGGLCKEDLKSYLHYCCEVYADDTELISVIRDIIKAPPSAELTGAEQRDEDEIGITYDEISVLGKVRRGIYGCSGPLGAFRYVWRNRKMSPFNTKIRCLQGADRQAGLVAAELGQLIKRFYTRYMNNRHKLTVLTPALHAETYSPDDNRFDHRQFLYPPMTRQFLNIDKMVASISENGELREQF